MAELSPGQKIIKSLLDSGNSEKEVARIRDNQTRFMLKAGMSKTQIDGFFGVNKTPDLTNLKNKFNENLDKNLVGPPEGVPPLLNNEDSTLLKSIEAGFEMSVIGLAGGPPDTILPENAPMFHSIVSSMATLVADLPIMIQAFSKFSFSCLVLNGSDLRINRRFWIDFQQVSRGNSRIF